MPLSRSRDYLSIGEVLDTIRPEFPDVSISKIRFLEAEGLISPRRTASGYRMFFPDDLARLRYILSLQRDHFLPLRVIKDRLAEADANGGGYDMSAPAAEPAAAPANGGAAAAAPAGDLTAVSLSRNELRDVAGLREDEIAGLEDFGLLPRRDGSSYDDGDLMIARAAKRFFDYGVEPRHLKMYRQFAERELAFFEQIVAPTLRRSDPSARDEAARSVRELAALSRQMREGTLRSTMRGHA